MEMVGSGGCRCICDMCGSSGCNFMNDRLAGVSLPLSNVVSNSIEAHVCYEQGKRWKEMERGKGKRKKRER